MTTALRSALLRLTEALNAGRITLSEWREAAVTLLTEAMPNIDDTALAQAVNTVRGTETPEDVVARLEALAAPRTNGVAVAAGVGLVAFLTQAFQRPRSAETTRMDAPEANNAALDSTMRRFEQRAAQLAQALVDGRITVQEWRVALASEIADLHVAAYVLGAGGVEQLDAEDFAALNDKLDEQLGYLNAWAAELDSGELPSLKALQARSNMYGSAAEVTQVRALTEAIGMPVLPAYPKDYQTDCRHNCYCHWRIETLDGVGNWDCYWEYDPLRDNCKQCPKRHEVWYPLQIRNGVIQPYNAVGLFRVAA